MATTSELEARLEAPKAPRDSAVAASPTMAAGSSTGGAAEIDRAIAELGREWQALEGKAPVRQIRVYASKAPGP